MLSWSETTLQHLMQPHQTPTVGLMLGQLQAFHRYPSNFFLSKCQKSCNFFKALPDIFFQFQMLPSISQAPFQFFSFIKVPQIWQHFKGKEKMFTQSVGFEPTLPEGIWFLVRRLNHSAMTAYIHYHFYWNKYETCLKHSPTPSPIYNFSELKFKDQQNFLKTFLKHVSDISNSGAARAPKVRGVRMPNLPPIFRKLTFYCIFMWQFFGFSNIRGVSWPLWLPSYVAPAKIKI